jgi:hypothetical protein
LPFKAIAPFAKELVIQRFGVMVVMDGKGLALMQLIEHLENGGMLLAGFQGSNIEKQAGFCVHIEMIF